MRTIMLSVCVFTAACSGPALDSPTSPTSQTLAPAQTQAPSGTAQTQAQSGAELPLRGSFTIATGSVPNCPPTCPPTSLQLTGTEEGTATHLGRFTAVSVDVVSLATATSTGTFNFTAANGDHLFTTTAGGEEEFIPPNNSAIALVATIVGGTGQFAAATGTFTIRYTLVIDFATGTSSGSGSLAGQINLNR